MKLLISSFALILLFQSATSQCYGACDDSNVLTLVSAASRKVHAAAPPPNTYDINLPLSGTPGIECRLGPDYTVVFTFSKPLQEVATARVWGGTASVNSHTVDGNKCIVELTNVTTYPQTFVVALGGVHDSRDYINASVAVSVLVGDSTGNGAVNASDVTQIKSNSGVTVGAGNFRTDITPNGEINASDVNLAKIYVGMQPQAPPASLPRLTVCEDRFLCAEGSGKFFWLGDTAWWLMNVNDHDVTDYLETRAAQKFNGIQIMALMLRFATVQENLGTNVDFYNSSPTDGGVLNPTCPNSRYWARFKWIIEEAERKGLYVGVFLVWGNEINGTNGYFNFNDTGKAQTYAQELATLLRDNKNVWYSVSGEYDSGSGSDALFASLATGLNAGSDQNAPPLISIHPSSALSSVAHFLNAPWLKFHMLESGHQFEHYVDTMQRTWKQTDELIDEGYLATNSNRKPIFDGEPLYDNIVDKAYHDGVITNRRANASLMRFKAYEAVFAGAFGHTHGHDNVHNFWISGDAPNVPWTRAINWMTAIDSNNYPGASQLRYLRELIECHSQNRIPDQCFIRKEGDPTSCAPTVYTGLSHIRATRESVGGNPDTSGRYALVYVPQGGVTFHVDMTKISGTSSTARWFNPQTGELGPDLMPDHTSSYHSFTSPSPPPVPDYVNDSVLVLESNLFPGPCN